jgi:hypothetical protein
VARAAAVALVLVMASCGSGSAAGRPGPTSTPVVLPTSTPLPTAPPCPAPSSPAAAAPIGAAQARTVVRVHVAAGVAVSPGVLQLGAVGCVSVGVGQQVAISVDARIPPLPAEPVGPRLLSAITVSPPVPGDPNQPHPGHYTFTFTAQAAGSTVITYLPATCNLPPGVC